MWPFTRKMWPARWRSSYSLWIVVKWKESNQKWWTALTWDVDGGELDGCLSCVFVCAVYSCVVWFRCVQFFVLTWYLLWTKLYVSKKQNVCGMLILFLTMTISTEQIHIFKTNTIAELNLWAVHWLGSQVMSRWNWPSEIKKPGHML